MKLSCMGDSITNGHGLDSKLRWTSLLANRLDIEVSNHGVSGDTTIGMVGRFDYMLRSEQPKYVFIMGGTNDLNFGLSDSLIISNIKTMTRQARHLGIQYIIGVPSTYYPSSDANLYEINVDEFVLRLKGLQARLKEFIQIDQCASIDFSYGLQRNHFLEDGIHPNASGQVIMAEKSIEVIREICY
jgi:acyl-CoA thioesterase I